MQTIASRITYRRMGEDDLRAAHALSQAVGWPHRLEDWQFVLRLGVGFLAEQDGEVVGTGLCWKHGERHASLGLIIVSPQHQGKGIGREVMALILAELGERRTLLNATPAGQPLYARLGFAPIGSVHQHQGTMLAAAPAPLAAGERIRPLQADDTAALIKLAGRAAGMPRASALAQLFTIADCNVLERDGEPAGFSIMRRFGRGHAIGPVVAPDSERAMALIADWTGTHAGSFVRIDVTATGGLENSLEQIGLAKVDTVTVMARNGQPAPEEAVRQFAIINQALC
ncbi:MAG: GNAT family N-acetyltransferase [Massilia sp.]